MGKYFDGEHPVRAEITARKQAYLLAVALRKQDVLFVLRCAPVESTPQSHGWRGIEVFCALCAPKSAHMQKRALLTLLVIRKNLRGG